MVTFGITDATPNAGQVRGPVRVAGINRATEKKLGLSMRRLRCLPWFLMLAWAGGCLHSAHDSVMKGLETDYQGLAAANMHLDRGGDWAKPRSGTDLATAATSEINPIQLVSNVQTADNQPPKKDGKFVLTIPPELPGSDDPGFKLPKDKAERDKYFAQIYPALPPLPDDLMLAPGPEGRPLTLADLQRLATQYSPSIRAAEAAVVAARGAVRQSLAYPNPTFAFEEDTIQTGQAGYPGFFVDQVIKTGNKLELQGASATMDLFNAYLALRRARSDVAYQVRSGYFAVLVAQENVYLSRAFARLTDQIDAHIAKAVDLGFLRATKSAEPVYEVRRILKAFVDGQWLADFDAKLAGYAATLTGETTPSGDDE